MKIIKMLFSPNTFLSWIKAKRYQSKNSDKKLIIDINSSLYNCSLGRHNCIGQKVVLKDTSLGDFSYVNSFTTIVGAEIGKFTSIGQEVLIGLGEHPTNMVSMHGAFYSKNKAFRTFADKEYFVEHEKISVGNDVWIGTRSIILNGVNIGDGAIVAAGSIVTKDVEPYSIVGGVPAKIIKYRFDKIIIDQLIKIKWWNLDYKWIEDNFKLFHNIEEFIEKFNDLKL